MSNPTDAKQSGLKAPSKIVRPTVGIPKPASSSLSTTSTSSLQAQKAALNTSSTNSIVSTSTTINTNQNDDENVNDFKINDRVWVNGTKQGVLAFIGETQFKEGVWAGVILDTAEGKNNGTLNGVTYFNCEENFGVFCRLNKLTRNQITEDVNTSQIVQKTTSQNEEEKLTEPLSNLKIGDRVVINNSGGGYKIGILRFIGTTDFAKGEWAGVELDEKLGKNDGSVGGKRYFQCEPLHGVFAPSQKVQLYTGNELIASDQKSVTSSPAQPVSKISSTSLLSKTKPTAIQSKLATSTTAAKTGISTLNRSKLNKQQSGSQESLISEKSSIYSTASAVLNKSGLPVVRKSISKATAPTTATTNVVTSTAAKKPMTPTVLQQSLKEKEGHINQLLKERDFERAEFTRAAQKFEQTESRLAEYTKLLEEKNDELARLNQLINQLNDNKTHLIAQCELDKTKIEDLEFQIEEHKLGCVSNDENKQSTSSPNHRDHEHDQVTSTTNPEEENIILKQLELQREVSKNHLEEIKFLKEQNDSLTIEVKQLRLGEEVYLKEKQDLRKNLEEIETQLNIAKKEAEENVQLREKIKNIEADFELKTKSDEASISQLKNELQDLNSKLQISENQKSDLEFVYEESKVKLSELAIKLENFRNENDNQTDIEFSLEEHKVMVQELESKLNNLKSEQDEQVKKLEDEINQLKEMNKKVELEKIDLQNESKNSKNKMEQKLEELNSILTKTSSNSNELNEKLNEKEALIKNLQCDLEKLKLEKEKEINELKQSNESKLNNSKQLTEKQQLIEQQLDESKKSNTELQTRISEMIQNSGDNSAQMISLNEKLNEKEKIIEEIQSSLANLQQELTKLREEKLNVENELSNLKSSFSQSKLELDAKIQQFETQNKDLVHKTEELNSNISNLTNQLSERENSLKTAEDNLKNLQTELNSLKEKLKESNDKLQEVESNLNNKEKEIENLNSELTKQKELNDLILKKENQSSESNEENLKAIQNLKVENDELKLKLENSSKNLELLSNEISEKLKQAEAKFEEEKQNQINQTSQNEAKYNEEKLNLTNEIANLKQNSDDLSSKINNLSHEKEGLIAERDSLRSDIDKLKSDFENLSNDKQNLHSQLDKLNNELLACKNDSSATELINQLRQELEETNQKVLKFEEKENQIKEEYETTIRDLKDLIQANDEESQQQQNEINELKSQFEHYELEIKNQKDIIEYIEAENEQLKEEIELLKQQTVQGSDVTSTDETVKHKYKLASEIRPAPRLYCDICDLFDLHETEDCPQQSMPQQLADKNEYETHSKYDAVKSNNRAYCDLCESFGHDENDCPTSGNENKHLSDEEF